MSFNNLELIIGPMFSGKSSELIRKIRLAKTINRTVLVIKPLIDTRYDNTKLVSHAFESENCETVENLKLIDDKIKNYDLIVIDEGQFFSDLKEYVLKWVEHDKKDVIVGGLDGDFKRQPIGQILELIPYSTKCHKINSLCKMCNNGNEANFTHRISATNNSQVLVGGTETYMPLCRKHFLELNELENDKSIEFIKKFIMNKLDLNRMKELDKIDENIKYEEFFNWNIKCINELSNKETIWLLNLCNNIQNNKINLVDLESCCSFEASNFYFDNDKNICIVNPR